MIRVAFSDTDDVADVISGLLEAAERWETTRPILARKYVRLADRIGDELDLLPNPSAFAAAVELRRATHVEAIAGAQ
jgi:hypothetical protein